MFILRALFSFEAFEFVARQCRREAEGVNDTGGWEIKIKGS